MTELGIILDIVIAICALLAAHYWYESSVVDLPDFRKLSTLALENDDGEVPATIYFKNVSQLNVKAARWAGMSAFTAAISVLVNYIK